MGVRRYLVGEASEVGEGDERTGSFAADDLELVLAKQSEQPRSLLEELLGGPSCGSEHVGDLALSELDLVPSELLRITQSLALEHRQDAGNLQLGGDRRLSEPDHHRSDLLRLLAAAALVERQLGLAQHLGLELLARTPRQHPCRGDAGRRGDLGLALRRLVADSEMRAQRFGQEGVVLVPATKTETEGSVPIVDCAGVDLDLPLRVAAFRQFPSLASFVAGLEQLAFPFADPDDFKRQRLEVLQSVLELVCSGT